MSRGRWRVAAGLLLLGLVATFLLLREPGRPVQGVNLMATQQATPSALAVQSPAVALPMPAQPAAAQDPQDAAWCLLPEPVMPESSASAPLDPGHWEAMQAASPQHQQQLQDEQRLRQEWARELARRGDERSLALSYRITPDPARLLELARRSSDPAVYAWAWLSCAGQPACQALSPRQWARLDPGNLQPWIWEASEARQRGDEQGLREALYQIGRAERSDNYGELPQQILLGLRRSPWLGLRQSTELMLEVGMRAAMVIPPLHTLTQHCKAGATLDANRQQLCASMAEALWRQPPNLIEPGIAVLLARSLPQRPAVWAARAEEWEARMQALTEEAQAELSAAQALEGANSCSLAPVMAAELRQFAELGEWGGSGQALARRGPGAQAALAKQWRGARGRGLPDAPP